MKMQDYIIGVRAAAQQLVIVLTNYRKWAMWFWDEFRRGLEERKGVTDVGYNDSARGGKISANRCANDIPPCKKQ